MIMNGAETLPVLDVSWAESVDGSLVLSDHMVQTLGTISSMVGSHTAYFSVYRSREMNYLCIENSLA